MKDHDKPIRDLLNENRKKATGRELHAIDTILNLPGAVRCFINAIRPIYTGGMPTRAEVRLGVAYIVAGCPESMRANQDLPRDETPLAILGPGGDYTREIKHHMGRNEK